MLNPQHEEWAALQALGLLDEDQHRNLLSAASVDPELALLIQDYERAATCLVYSLPSVTPPEEFKRELLEQIPLQKGLPSWNHLKVWMPYTACGLLFLLNLTLFLSWNAMRGEVAILKEKTTAFPVPDVRPIPVPVDPPWGELVLQDTKSSLTSPPYENARAYLAWDHSTGRGSLLTRRLPALQPGTHWAAWAILGHQEAQSLGALQEGRLNFQIKPASPAALEMIRLTLETTETPLHPAKTSVFEFPVK